MFEKFNSQQAQRVCVTNSQKNENSKGKTLKKLKMKLKRTNMKNEKTFPPSTFYFYLFILNIIINFLLLLHVSI